MDDYLDAFEDTPPTPESAASVLREVVEDQLDEHSTDRPFWIVMALSQFRAGVKEIHDLRSEGVNEACEDLEDELIELGAEVGLGKALSLVDGAFLEGREVLAEHLIESLAFGTAHQKLEALSHIEVVQPLIDEVVEALRYQDEWQPLMDVTQDIDHDHAAVLSYVREIMYDNLVDPDTASTP